MMLEILQKTLIALFGLALIYFPITYRMMDKVRFHGRMCVRQMDDGLLRWIETAAAGVALDESDARQRRSTRRSRMPTAISPFWTGTTTKTP